MNTLMCEEHDFPLTDIGYCSNCECILDMQSTYIKTTTEDEQ